MSAQAFYKDADAEPPYAQFARGVKEGFELGRRNATQDAANVAPAQPPREQLREALRAYRSANPSRFLNAEQVAADDAEFVAELMKVWPAAQEKP